MVDEAQFFDLALSFEQSISKPHFERTGFRSALHLQRFWAKFRSCRATQPKSHEILFDFAYTLSSESH